MKLLKDVARPMKKPGAEAPGFNGSDQRLVYQIETRCSGGRVNALLRNMHIFNSK
mgnify:CR=1 FL=1